MDRKLINYRPMYISNFQKDNIYKSDNALREVWERIQRFSSQSILRKEYKVSIHPENFERLITYISTRISQSVEFWEASKNQTLLSRPLSLYYSMLNLMRSTIALNEEIEAKARHGLNFKANRNILDSEAVISDGTFSQYLKIRKINEKKGKTITLKESISKIIELGKEIQTIKNVDLGFTPFNISVYRDGEIIIKALEYNSNFESNWKSEFPILADHYSLVDNYSLHYKDDKFKNGSVVIEYINNTFMTDLNYLKENDSCIWYLYNQKKEECLPRICYYYIAFFILSNIVRYEPESLQEIIANKDEVYWLLNKLQYFGERYFPQLILQEIYGVPIYL